MADERTLGERVSDDVAHFGGSWKFIFIFSAFLALWILFNTISFFEAWAFDKNPYILLNLILSFIAAFQAPFIMMSQNRAEKKQDIAYRMLFHELKELLEADFEKEQEIERLSQEIKKNQEIAREQHERLLTLLTQTLSLQEHNKQGLQELIELHEDIVEGEDRAARPVNFVTAILLNVFLQAFIQSIESIDEVFAKHLQKQLFVTFVLPFNFLKVHRPRRAEHFIENPLTLFLFLLFGNLDFWRIMVGVFTTFLQEVIVHVAWINYFQ